MSRNSGLSSRKTVLVALIVAIPVLASNMVAAGNYKTLHKFTSSKGKQGFEPVAGVILDQAGNLYGTAYAGGANKAGAVFELTHNEDGSWSESVLYSFCSLGKGCSDGARPAAGLTFDQAGNLYGATEGGGASNWGTVFKLTPNADGT